MTKYFAYQTKDVVVLFSRQLNHNKKVAIPGQLILNHFTFSKTQWDKTEELEGFAFFDEDQSNCLSCVYRGKKGKCYTHKFHSYISFLNHIKAAKKQLGEIPMLENFNWKALYSEAKNCSYFRVGVYGEPVFIPLDNLGEIIKNCPKYTGYTYAWMDYPEYKKYILASCNNANETLLAMAMGWKTFTSINDLSELKGMEKNFILCPASKEGGKLTLCSLCGLCSINKKSKPIYVFEH